MSILCQWIRRRDASYLPVTDTLNPPTWPSSRTNRPTSVTFLFPLPNENHRPTSPSTGTVSNTTSLKGATPSHVHAQNKTNRVFPSFILTIVGNTQTSKVPQTLLRFYRVSFILCTRRLRASLQIWSGAVKPRTEVVPSVTTLSGSLSQTRGRDGGIIGYFLPF